jgi:thiamine biosynthesis lipoprotein
MATRFELLLLGRRPESLRAAAEEALDEIERVEEWMSPYRPESEWVRLHREGVGRPVRVDPRLFAFLWRARELTEKTGGMFDPTVGPLLRAWGFRGGASEMPDPGAVAAARELVGWRQVELDLDRGTVCLLRPGVEIHPGAMGKGYALDRAVEILREAGVENGIIHGGTSTVCALGTPSDGEGWPVLLPEPPPGTGVAWPEGRPPRVLLRDTTLSVSAVWGRGDSPVSHVLDPRTGNPTRGLALAAVVAESATDSDVWSTALLVGGPEVLQGGPVEQWWELGEG